MISLERFGMADFHYLKNWIGSEEELIQFAGPLFTYPLTAEQFSD